MPVPTFQHPSGTPTPEPLIMVKPAVAAARLGISRASFDKLRESEILPRPTPAEHVDLIAARPSLRVTTGELTVLRTAARATAYDADRQWIGYHVDHTDSELDAACLRWWRADADKVVDNRLYAVTVATVPVAVYEITGVEDSHQRMEESGMRYHFTGRLLARLGGQRHRPHVLAEYTYPGPSIDDLTSIRVDAADPLYEPTHQIMSSRITVASGGPIGYLTS